MFWISTFKPILLDIDNSSAIILVSFVFFDLYFLFLNNETKFSACLTDSFFSIILLATKLAFSKPTKILACPVVNFCVSINFITSSGNVNILNDVIDKLIEGDDVAYKNVNKRFERQITEIKKANNGEITLGQLAVIEADYYKELKNLGLRTDLGTPSFFTGDETSTQGNESYSTKVGRANNLASKMKFKEDWVAIKRKGQDPFAGLDANEFLAIPSAEAELARRINQTMEEEGISLDEAFSIHYNPVLKELSEGKFNITVDRLRITSPTDITNDINASKSNKSEWLANEATNSVFEKRALMQYIQRKDNNFDGDIAIYLRKVGAVYGLTGRQYAIERLRAMGLLSKNNKFADNPEDKLELSDQEKKFLYLNSNATKNLMLLNTKDDNRSNEAAMLNVLKNGNSVEYFEGKGLISSFLDNVGSGQTIRTVREVYNLAKSGKATNFGLYGFSAEELIDAVDSGAISLDADFDENTQSLAAIELVRVQANKSNSIMGALTEADKDWRRLSDLNEIEKAVVLRFFPSLRNMPMNQFHNLQQDIANVFLTEMETLNKNFEKAGVSVDATQFKDKKALINQILQPNLVFDSKEKIEETIKIRQFYENKIRKSEEVDIEIRRALQGTSPVYINVPFGEGTYSSNKFNYFQQPKKEE